MEKQAAYTIYDKAFHKAKALKFYKELWLHNKHGLNNYDQHQLQELMQPLNDQLQAHARKVPVMELLRLGMPVYVPPVVEQLEEERGFSDAYDKHLAGYWYPSINPIDNNLMLCWINRQDGRVEDMADREELEYRERNFVVVLPCQPVVSLFFEEENMQLSPPEHLPNPPFPTKEPDGDD